MSFATLKRRDNSNKLDSYVHVYDTKSLYLLKKEYRNNILRIVKKSILGTNFSFWYSKHAAFISAILNFIIINTCFVIFPQIFFHSVNIEQLIDDMELQEESDDPPKIIKKKSTDLLFRLYISNLIDMTILAVLTINYKYKQKKINKYMVKCTQCAIESENNIMKNKFKCLISEDGNFSIKINLVKNHNNNAPMKPVSYKNKYFFEYVINFPNVRHASNYLYKKVLLPKEKEIINYIMEISNLIELKYKKKLIKFLLMIITILLSIPIIKYFSYEKRLDILNYFGIFSLCLFVQINIIFDNKEEQIQSVLLLNNKYINDGYYIYINNHIISLFYLKEEYRNIDSINKVKELNEKFLSTFDLI